MRLESMEVSLQRALGVNEDPRLVQKIFIKM